MAYYTEISADNNTLVKELILTCENAHRIAAEKTFSQAKLNKIWEKAELIELDNTTSRIVTDSIMAFMYAFGSGEKMVLGDENPYLEDYMDSGMFNSLRRSNPRKVYYRGKHTTYDWQNDSRNIVERSGVPSLEGKVMTSFKGIKPQKHNGPFEDYKELYKNILTKEIQKAINSDGGEILKKALRVKKVVVK